MSRHQSGEAITLEQLREAVDKAFEIMPPSNQLTEDEYTMFQRLGWCVVDRGQSNITLLVDPNRVTYSVKVPTNG